MALKGKFLSTRGLLHIIMAMLSAPRAAAVVFDVAVVTGAGTGIGAAAARRLLASGAARRVVGVGRRPFASDDLESVAADVSTPEGRAAVLAAVGRDKQTMCVVHAAAATGEGDALGLTLEQFRATMATNVEAPLFLTQALAPSMARGSRILHLSSGAAHGGVGGMLSYCSSKAALLSVAQTLDAELTPLGVRVGSVMPGVVETPMQEHLSSTDHPMRPYFDQLKAETTPQPPAPRPPPARGLDTAENVGYFVAWLLTETGDEEFAASDWDIRDPKHHERWCR